MACARVVMAFTEPGRPDGSARELTIAPVEPKSDRSRPDDAVTLVACAVQARGRRLTGSRTVGEVFSIQSEGVRPLIPRNRAAPDHHRRKPHEVVVVESR